MNKRKLDALRLTLNAALSAQYPELNIDEKRYLLADVDKLFKAAEIGFGALALEQQEYHS